MSNVILIVDARFYDDIADELNAGAKAALITAGYSYESISVPGALEIPTAIRMAMETGKYAGYVALGCVIRGETTHYDYVCAESARGLADLAMQYMVPIGNGILTVENRTQALARARVADKDKGGFAANACVAMLTLKRQFGLIKDAA
ncbi:MAG: 6,7-dimethyl-8-ribityllumazine synthase [Alphaproteobacteria bacterium]|nr:6,7-dimethyl-8-ribityllumazine synthase [Alphaproteobacteria bacterium]